MYNMDKEREIRGDFVFVVIVVIVEGKKKLYGRGFSEKTTVFNVFFFCNSEIKQTGCGCSFSADKISLNSVKSLTVSFHIAFIFLIII